jgi:hypothetical protein
LDRPQRHHDRGVATVGWQPKRRLQPANTVSRPQGPYTYILFTSVVYNQQTLLVGLKDTYTYILFTSVTYNQQTL